MNYLRPDIKRGNITPDEDDLIVKMHALLGNRWSLIAGRLPGRTDNEIKNYWNTHLTKKLRSLGTDPTTHKKLSESHVQEQKKRKNSSKKKKPKPKPKPEAEPEKLKVHNPKPIRIKSLGSFSMSRNTSFDWTTTTTTASGTEVADDPWSNFKYTEVGFLIGDDQDHDMINGSDLECHAGVPMSNHTLEKLYEEYLQLLKTEDHDHVELDSFAESLLI